MLKMKFWFEGNQLQPDCNIHGGCKIGSSACHACPHCVRVNSKDQEVLCLGDGSEYKEVKLDEFILKNPKFNEIPSEQKPLMYAQMNAMDDYRQNLRARMSLLGITNDDIAAYKHPYQNLSFGEALQALEAGKCVRRESWIGDKFVVKQIDSDISAEIVPKMQSLPDSAKELIGKTADKDIHYRNQCLIVKQYPSSTVATNYVPDWNDMFAKDWMVL